eukprot:8055645-Pyramimonas_sp.AAC.1
MRPPIQYNASRPHRELHGRFQFYRPHASPQPSTAFRGPPPLPPCVRPPSTAFRGTIGSPTE